MPKVKLHRCSYTFLHADMDACWRMQMTGQKYVPVLELADGSIYREETDDMIAKLKSGELPGPTS